MDVVECIMEQIEQMEENLVTLTRDDFRLVPHQMEVNRIKFLLASYHRCRLSKIEKYCVFLIGKENSTEPSERLLSPSELKFAEEFLALRTTHFKNEALRYLPNTLNASEVQAEIPPFHESAVFIDVVKTGQNLLVAGSDEEIQLAMGSRYLLPYENVSNLVNDGSVVLI